MDKLKEWSRKVDWWETAYLMIYGIIFAKEFLQTTMFPIPWPLGLGYVFALLSGGYVIAKFLFHNTYTKKETILAILILIAFCIPAFTTDYTFLFWTGCMIVGAKDVDFNKILKVYLVIGITIMVAAFAASQCGLIEDLVYELRRWGNESETVVRHSYGIIYPTDYAAHLFFLVLAAIVFYGEKLATITKTWMCLLVAVSTYLTANAQTTMLCLAGFVGLCVVENIFRKYMHAIEKMFRWVPVVSALGYLSVAFTYRPEVTWMVNLNALLSMRLDFSRRAIDRYGMTWFGQTISEVGNGLSILGSAEYFFLDDSYIRILLKYGIVLLVMVLVILVLTSKRAADKRNFMLVIAIVAIAVHSIMEHRLIDMAYNPMILALFAFLDNKEQGDRRRTCIEETVKIG